MSKDNKYIPSGYKPSPLGIIPEDWEVKRLGKICTHFKSGITITSKDIHEDGLYPVYGGNGLRGYANTFTHDGSYILIGRQGALCGNVNYVDGKNYISEHAIAVQTNENMQWLKYKLENWNLNRFSESSAQPGLSVEKLVRYKLSVPTLKEQNKIADILSLWDTAIAKQTALIEKLTLRKRGLMQQLLTGKKRLEGFSGEWKRTPIKDFAKEVSVRNSNREDHIVLSCTKYDGLVPSLEYFGKQIYSDDLSSYKKIPQGHFAYATNHIEEGSIGYQSKYEQGLISPMYTVFITDRKKVDDAFLFAVFKSHHLIHLYKSMMEGSINRRGGLRWDSFSTIKINLPPLDEQTAIASVLINADKEIEIQKQKLAAMQEQKKGLMQELLSGKRRVE